MKSSINFNQFSLQVKAGLISYVISWSCIISKETSAKVYFSFWMKGAKTNIREREREEGMFITFTCTRVLPTWREGQEAAGGLPSPIATTVLRGPRTLSCLGVLSNLFYMALSNFSPMSCCAIAQAPVSTVSLQSQLNIQILTPSFSSQRYWWHQLTSIILLC